METTSTQRDYTERRDECRQYADMQAGVGAGGGPADEANKKRLINMFGNCMKKYGWSVTTPDPQDRPASALAPQPAPVQRVAPIEPVIAMDENPNAQRAAECAYARHAATHSSNARILAEECDRECAAQIKLAPNMPNPAACAR